MATGQLRYWQVTQKGERIISRKKNWPYCVRQSRNSKMEKKLFAELLESIKDMKEVRAGRKKPGRRFIVVPAHSKVPAIRRGLGLSQSEFAAMLGISVKTLRHWE